MYRRNSLDADNGSGLNIAVILATRLRGAFGKNFFRLIVTSIAIFLILSAGMAIVVIGTAAQSEGEAEAALPPEARQFDFWLGNWNLAIGSGSSKSQITSFGVGGGIATLENFSNGLGTSVSIYDTREQKWYQTWFDQDQLLIEVSGEFQNGRMVLTGQETRTTTGVKMSGRESWFNITDNQWDFLYEVSANGGQTWQQNFLAHGRRADSLVSARTLSSSSQGGGQNVITISSLPKKFRQFDFLKGEWEVEDPDCASQASVTGTLFGAGGGFAMLEDFRCGDDYRGTSVSFYDTRAGMWRYMWLDTEGLLLELKGNEEDNDMVFQGEFDDPQTGLTMLGRVTYDSISQSAADRKFEVSEDNGLTWTVKRIHHYVKASVFQPDNFEAKKVKANKVKLAWIDTSPGENRFEVLQWDGAQWIVVKTLAANSTAAKIKKLQSGTEYRFAVRACDSSHCSDQSEITVTTP